MICQAGVLLQVRAVVLPPPAMRGNVVFGSKTKSSRPKEPRRHGKRSRESRGRWKEMQAS